MNPYSAPIEESDAPAPDLPLLFSPGQVLVVSILGSVIAGGILVAINEARLGRAARGIALVVGAVAAVAVLVLLPDDLPGSRLAGFGLAFAMWSLAKHWHGNALEAGSPRASHGAAAGWAVGGILATAAVVVAVIGATDGLHTLLPQDEVEIGPEQHVYYYKGEVDEADARHLADRLRELDFLGDGPSDVDLDRNGDTLELCFFVDPEISQSEIAEWGDTMDQLIPEIYANQAARVYLCEPEGDRIQQIYP